MSGDSKLFIGLVLGAAAGVLTGLLVAPASGEETREKIKASAKDFKHDLDEKFKDLSHKISDLENESMKEFKTKFENVKGDVKQKYNDIGNKVKNLEHELEKKIKELKKEAKEIETEQV